MWMLHSFGIQNIIFSRCFPLSSATHPLLKMISPESNIIIVGAGVFGLSTALWLARAGYKNITVFDRCAFDKNNYNPADGCDGASADINKVFRATYGSKKEYALGKRTSFSRSG